MTTYRSKLFLLLFTCSPWLAAQEPDTVKRTIDLREVEVQAPIGRNSLERLPQVQGTLINTGKKNEVIKVGALDADLSTNNTRQVFAKVPGLTIWESDGSGIQTGIATRGLSPNRSWEFNVRQNGYDICAEIFGYPEAYYSPPMEGVERIEIVRGAASLQYGPQFGGLLNYVMKKGPKDKELAVETRQTVGSYGLFNSYNAIGGTKGRFNYYVFMHHRNADGWRENSRYVTNTVSGSVTYSPSKRTSIALDYTWSNYQSQQPGGLTDSLFAIDPRSSTRARNWFSAPWNVAALTLDHQINEDLKLNVRLFTTVAQRNSVGFMRPINVADAFEPEAGSFGKRQVDRDGYTNAGAEVRMLKSYQLFGRKNHLSAGVRSYKGTISRRQQGVGSGGSDLDISVSAPFARDFTLGTVDHAIFLENQFRLTERLSIVPGVRYEMIGSSVEGRMNANGDRTEREQNRNILLYGVGSEYQLTATTNIYANYSQAYRPVMYSELIPSATTDVIDPDLKDASGFNADLGYRGTWKEYLQFDLGVFYLHYDGRIGTVTRDGVPFRTNIGTSVSKGVESYVEWDPVRMLTPRSRIGNLKLFLSYANVDARYTRWDDPATQNDPAKDRTGKRVEYSPETIARFGATYHYRRFSITFQGSDVGAIYTDANNTEAANAAGTIGRLEGYRVFDISATLLTAKGLEFRAGVNNINDTRYATRRAGGYPGPGIMPANGRTLWLSVAAKF